MRLMIHHGRTEGERKPIVGIPFDALTAGVWGKKIEFFFLLSFPSIYIYSFFRLRHGNQLNSRLHLKGEWEYRERGFTFSSRHTLIVRCRGTPCATSRASLCLYLTFFRVGFLGNNFNALSLLPPLPNNKCTGLCAYLNNANQAITTEEGKMNIYVCAAFSAAFAASAAGVIKLKAD